MFESGGKETQVSRAERSIISSSPEQTRKVGYRVGRSLDAGSVVLLTGPIGAGKSVLARGIGEALGIQQWRGSPTFTIVHEYQANPALYHVDLYRLTEPEIEDLGLEEYVRADSIVIVEWADRALAYLMELAGGAAIRLDLAVVDRERRAITAHDPSSVHPAPDARPHYVP